MSIKRISNNRATRRHISTDKFPSRKGLLKVNNLSFPVVTQWQSYSLSIVADPTNPTKASSPTIDQARWRRVGDSMQIQYTYEHTSATGSAAGSGNYGFSLPSGYAIDTNKLATGGPSGGRFVVGTCTANNGSVTISGYATTAGLSGPSLGQICLVAGSSANAHTAISSAFFPITGATTRYSFEAIVPIQGWDANGSGSIEEIIESSFFDLNAKNEIFNSHIDDISVADNTYTDVLSTNLPEGTYLIDYGFNGQATYSVSPTEVRIYGRLTESDSTPIVNTDTGSIGIARLPAISQFKGQASHVLKLTWTGGIIKIQAVVDTVGGTVTDRAIDNIFFRATKISD